VDSILWVGGIVNGTTNLILDTMQSSDAGFHEVLQEAQRMGYAEADPSSDIDGVDARSKLTIAMNLAFDGVVDPGAILTEGIRNLTGQDIRCFKKLGLVCRFLSSARRLENGAWVENEPRAYDPAAVYGGKA
jgi:homoserine dehydrogenase